MPRPLSAALDAVMLSGVRRPGYLVVVYDLRSSAGLTINDVVLGNVPASFIRNFTPDTVEVTLVETAGDYVDAGIASSTCSLTVEGRKFDPLGSEPENVWLRQDNVVRIIEGDNQVSVTEWPITFTGTINGQPGYDEQRSAGRATLAVSAISREAGFLRAKTTSIDFPQNTTYFDMAEEIVTNDMDLTLAEINWPNWGLQTTAFLSTQFVEEEPLVQIARVMFPDGFMPRFEGDGRLGLTTGIISKAPTRVYSDNELQITVKRPQTSDKGINKVVIRGLSDELSKVVGPSQLLAESTVTLGFFTQDTTIKVRWSDDGTQQAQNTFLRIVKDINGIFNFGDQSYEPIPQPDQPELSTEGRIFVDTGFHPAVTTLMLVTKAADAAIPDTVTVAGIGVSAGSTISVGRLIEAVTDVAIDLVLGQIGAGQYEIIGEPIEFIYEEVKGTAKVKDLRSEDEVLAEIENHLINSEADAGTVALRVLRRERAKQNVRDIEALHDLILVPDDVFELADGRRYMIDSIARTLTRGGPGGRATYDCFEVTTGVRV